jgi:hypothetical protein
MCSGLAKGLKPDSCSRRTRIVGTGPTTHSAETPHYVMNARHARKCETGAGFIRVHPCPSVVKLLFGLERKSQRELQGPGGIAWPGIKIIAIFQADWANEGSPAQAATH